MNKQNQEKPMVDSFRIVVLYSDTQWKIIFSMPEWQRCRKNKRYSNMKAKSGKQRNRESGGG